MQRKKYGNPISPNAVAHPLFVYKSVSERNSRAKKGLRLTTKKMSTRRLSILFKAIITTYLIAKKTWRSSAIDRDVTKVVPEKAFISDLTESCRSSLHRLRERIREKRQGNKKRGKVDQVDEDSPNETTAGKTSIQIKPIDGRHDYPLGYRKKTVPTGGEARLFLGLSKDEIEEEDGGGGSKKGKDSAHIRRQQIWISKRRVTADELVFLPLLLLNFK